MKKNKQRENSSGSAGRWQKSKHASNQIQWQQKWKPDYSIDPGFAHAGTERLDPTKREEQVTQQKVNNFSIKN
jgi:hypothetical protein